jgi:uncharacterized protein (DUF488 family)
MYNRAMSGGQPSCDPRDAEGRVLLLTIGYGNDRSSEEFVQLLESYGVRYLVDVRSKPYSRHRPEFSREALEAIVRRAGLSYVYMGDRLGGLPEDTDCYREGKVDYGLVRQRPWFQAALDRLESGWQAGHRIALMCAELEPERCHRSKLIGEALVERRITVGHIDEEGAVVSHQSVLDRVTGGQGELFGRELTSRKAYRRGADEEEAA